MASIAGSPGRNERCPCGSGKKFKKCCAGKTPIAGSGRFWMVTGGVLLVAAAIVLIGVILGDSESPGDTRRPQAASAPGTAPAPYQYDALTDHYWNPACKHWHPGQPPSGSAATESLFQPAATPIPTAATENTPAPWEYFPETNKYWDPEHGHLHTGKPPTDAGAAGPVSATTATPAPWEYNPQTNKFWHPQHKHWDPGTPPPESERQSP